MKKNLKAFTLAELLIVIVIIGVIAALTIPSLGQRVDRNKGLFKKTYSVTERTVSELVNDETYYPFDHSNFGFKETTDVKIIGPDCYTSTTDYNNKVTTRGSVNRLVKFCNLFSNNMNLNQNPTYDGNATTSKKCNFITNDGVDWIITDVTTPVNGFLIEIDVNGTSNKKAPNKPEFKDISSEGNIRNRDRFYMYVRYDGKMQVPDNDTVAKSYLMSADLNREQ